MSAGAPRVTPRPPPASPSTVLHPPHPRSSRVFLSSPRTPRHAASPRRELPTGFRSASLQNQIAQLEQHVNGRTELTPDEALAELRHLASTELPAIGNDCMAVERVAAGLEAACWKTVASASDDASDGDRSNQVPYAQLLRGTEASIREKIAARRDCHAQYLAVVERNRELPLKIRTRQQEIATTTTAFAAHTARALHNLAGNVGGKKSATVSAHLSALRRRKELRVWACGELRVSISDLTTRATELKKQIAAVVADVKKEEAANKVKAKRIEDTNALLAASTQRNTSSPTTQAGRSSVVSTRRMNAVLSALTGVNHNEPPPTSSDRVERARERKTYLLGEIAARRAVVRERTEQVFDVRRVARELETAKRDQDAAIAVVNEKIAHIERAYTPRPDWHELQSTTAVTTAVDRGGRRAKLRNGASRRTQRRKNSQNQANSGGGAAFREAAHGDEDEEVSERRLQEILASNWSTIDKVIAMSDALAHIRTRHHSGDAISAEQAKLDHLQREIAKTLLQLESARARAT